MSYRFTRPFSAFALLSLAVLAACGGASDLGESCDVSGDADECVEGAICGQTGDNGALTCLRACTDQSQCGTGEDCNGVSGTSTKGCRPKSTTGKK